MTPLLRPRNHPLLVHLLHQRFHWFHQAMLATLPDVGLEHVTPVQCHLLSRIDRHGTRTAELARRLGVTRQAAHQQGRELRYIHYGMEGILFDRIGEGDVSVLFTVLKEDWGSPIPPYPEPVSALGPQEVQLPPPTRPRSAGRRR